MDTAATWRAETRSTVAFDLEEAAGGVVKLTVVHDGFEPGSEVLKGITNGWPAVISSLKTLLETGSALPAPERRASTLRPRPSVASAPAGGGDRAPSPLRSRFLWSRILSMLLRSERS